MRRRFPRARLAEIAVLAATLVCAAAPVARAAAPVVTAESYPVIQGSINPLGDVAVDESAVGELVQGDVITFRFTDGSNGSTFHLNPGAVASGTLGLGATAVVASSSGTLSDEVIVTVTSPSSGAFPGVLTLTGLEGSVDLAAPSAPNVVRVSDSMSLIASSGSPATTSDADAIGTSPSATFAAKTAPAIDITGSNMAAGQLTITEPAKVFFHTGDVITFTIRDRDGTRDTVGLAGPPTASGGGMIVSVTGITGSTVQPNATAFKVSIDQQDPSNGSASAITVSNITLNTAQAPAGPVVITAAVTTGSGSEYIAPGRVGAALVGGGTTTTSAGQPVVSTGATSQPAANLTVSEMSGTLKPSTTFSIAIQEPGVTFSPSAPPLADVTGGNLVLTSGTPTIDGTGTVATWTVASQSTLPSRIEIAPIEYDVAASGPIANDTVSLVASGGTGSGFTTETVANALIMPTGKTLFTSSNTTAAPDTAGDVTYQEVTGARASTGGSIVLIAPSPGQLLAYRATFAAAPTATVNNPGSGLVLGAGSVNAGPITVNTPSGPITVRAESAAIFPVTTGSSTAASVTFTNILYTAGALVPPGAMVAQGVVDTGANGSGSNVSGNSFVNAFNPVPAGWGSATLSPTPSYQPDMQLELASSTSFLGEGIYGTTSGQTVSKVVTPGKRFVVLVAVQNQGTGIDAFTLHGPGNRKNFKVRYLLGVSGPTDITSQVESGMYITPSVGPHTSVLLRLVVRARSWALKGATAGWTLRAVSHSNAAVSDVVRATGTVAQAGLRVAYLTTRQISSARGFRVG
jgi:hypothetical protein